MRFDIFQDMLAIKPLATRNHKLLASIDFFRKVTVKFVKNDLFNEKLMASLDSS